MKVLVTALSFVLAGLASIPTTLAVCGSNEVGVGREQIYDWSGQHNTLESDEYVITTNKCKILGSSQHEFKDNPCDAGPGYGPGSGIQCDGNGNPDFVWTNQGNYHNCYSVGGTCETGPWYYLDIYYCCQVWE
jgi:hypothetical protein